MSRFLLLWTAVLLAAGCGSTGRADVAGGASVTLTEHRAGMSLGIVSDGLLLHMGLEGETPSLRRAAYYSNRRGDLGPKVADDDLVAGLIAALDQTGMRTYGRDGAVPDDGAATSIEVVQAGRHRHFMFRDGMTAAELQAYKECRRVFILAYNEIPQYQSATADQIRFD